MFTIRWVNIAGQKPVSTKTNGRFDLNGFSELLRRLGAGRLIAMTIVSAALIAFFIYVTMRFTEPPMSLLYSDLDMADSGEILAKLEALDIPYQLQGDGNTILVPEDQARRLRMVLAEQGLPAGGSVGYELFDKSDALGQTSFVQNVNQLRAMEGELARTIRSIDSVANARVHLVMPRRELFASGKKQEPTASIVLKVRNSFGPSQVDAIQHLVAAAVPGLNPSRVAIVDDKGKLLARGSDDEFNSGTVTNIQDANANFEAMIANRVQMMIGSIVGTENVRVQVAARANLDRITENAEIFDPNGRVIRSTNSMEEESQDTEPQAKSTSVAGALPEAAGAASTSAQGAPASTDSRTEETANFEISRTVRTKTTEAGAIDRVSVAVLVNGSLKPQPDGTRVYEPRTEEELKQIEALVRTAIGYDEKRGDEVRVINLRFSELELPAVEEIAQPFLGLETSDWMRLAETGALALVALLTLLFVFRPLILRLLDAAPGGGAMQPALAASGGAPLAQLTGPGNSAMMQASGQQQITGANAGDHARPPAFPGISQLESMIDISQIEGQVKASSIRKVGEVIERHPEEAIAIMRTWLHNKA